MTGSDLAQLLASARVTAPAPTVAGLQAHHRRRRQRAAAVGALATAVVLVAAATAAIRLRSETATVEAVGSVRTGPPFLVPPAEWRLDGVSSQPAGPDERIVVATDEGGLGPVAWIQLRTDDPGPDGYDAPAGSPQVVTPGGRTVTIWSVTDPGDLTAVEATGSLRLIVTAYDIEEADVLRLVDAVTVVDGRPVADPDALPAGLRVHPMAPAGRYLGTSYVFKKGDLYLHVIMIPASGSGLDYLETVRMRPDLVETASDGRRVVLAPGDIGDGNWPTAIIYTRDAAYYLQLPPPGRSPATVTADELATLVDSLTPISDQELMARAPWLQDRANLLDRWFDDVLPAGADLDWLREGPPLALDEADSYRQLLACALVLHWARTGDGATLDELARSSTWAISADRTASGHLPDGDDGNAIDLDLVADARAATTPEARRATELVANCEWAAPFTDPG